MPLLVYVKYYTILSISLTSTWNWPLLCVPLLFPAHALPGNARRIRRSVSLSNSEPTRGTALALASYYTACIVIIERIAMRTLESGDMKREEIQNKT